MQPLRYQKPIDYNALFGPGELKLSDDQNPGGNKKKYNRSPGLSALASYLMKTPAKEPLTPNQTDAFNTGSGPVNADYANLLADQTYNAGTPNYFNSAMDLTAAEKQRSY